MRTAKFEVPEEAVLEFSKALVESGLNNTITSTTEDGEVVIEVDYDRDEAQEVDELEAALDRIREELQEEDDDN